jgi:hypothetical protein
VTGLAEDIRAAVAALPSHEALSLRDLVVRPLRDALMLHYVGLIGDAELLSITSATNDILAELPTGVGAPPSLAVTLRRLAAEHRAAIEAAR